MSAPAFLVKIDDVIINVNDISHVVSRYGMGEREVGVRVRFMLNKDIVDVDLPMEEFMTELAGSALRLKIND